MRLELLGDLGAVAANNTLYRSVKDGKVFVILNNIRHWITTRATFDAIGFYYGSVKDNPKGWIYTDSIPFPNGQNITTKAEYDALLKKAQTTAAVAVVNSLTTVNPIVTSVVNTQVSTTPPKPQTFIEKAIDLVSSGNIVDTAVDTVFDALPDSVTYVVATGINTLIPSESEPVNKPVSTTVTPAETSVDVKPSGTPSASLPVERERVETVYASASAQTTSEPQVKLLDENGKDMEDKKMSTGLKVGLILGGVALVAGGVMMMVPGDKPKRSGLGRINKRKKIKRTSKVRAPKKRKAVTKRRKLVRRKTRR